MKADVRIFKDKEALSQAAANLFVEVAVRVLEKRGRFLVALSGGGTPSGLYQYLATEPFRNRLDWNKTFVFWGDERCVPPDDSGSNYYQAYEILFKYVPIPDENIQRIKGELGPVEASKSYNRTLKAFASPPLDWPRFDLVLLGMGEDGHTASLFPGSKVEVSSPTLPVIAHYQDRPAERVTLTSLVINSAWEIMFLVIGQNKAATLKEVLHGTYQPELLPAQRIHPLEGNVIWLADEAAGNNL